MRRIDRKDERRGVLGLGDCCGSMGDVDGGWW